MKCKTMMLTILALILIGAGAAWGTSTATKDVTLSATVSSSAKLTLATSTISFPDGDPDAALPIAATENPAVVTAKVKTGSASTATLKVLAADDLKNAAGDVIPITKVTSTATNTTGSFFSAGPVIWSKTGEGATVGQGNSGSYAGTFNWFLANSWDYATGSYTTTAKYTLTAP